MTVKMPVGNKGLFTLIDKRDAQRLGRWHWTVATMRGRKYVMRVFYGRKKRTVLLHRAVMGAKFGEVVDHINGDSLDNRRANLRRCTSKENLRNRIRKYRRPCSSKFKGVCWLPKRRKWRASICVNYRTIYLGDWKEEKAAAQAYNRAAKKYFGAFAALNP